MMIPVMPAALGLAVAIMAVWGYRWPSAWVAEVEAEMRVAVVELGDYLTRCGRR